MAVLIRTVSVVPGGFEVAVDSELSTRRVRHDIHCVHEKSNPLDNVQ